MPSLADAAALAGDAHLFSLPSLQSRMKQDPDGYTAELALLARRFESSIQLFSTSAAASSGEISKELGDLALFLSHVADLYPEELSDLGSRLMGLLKENARGLPHGLRLRLAQALVLLNNRKIVNLEDTLELFMDLQLVGDRLLKKLAFSHIVHSIRRTNQKHKNVKWNRELKKVLLKLLHGEEESRAKQSLSIVCDLHRRRIWFDDVTANAICEACLHESSKVMVAALSFLLGYEKAEDQDDSEDSSDEESTVPISVVIDKESLIKAQKGTAASKKKKKAKMQRVVRSMKRKQLRELKDSNPNYYSPLTYLKDPQGFVEKLFSRLLKCNERFEVRMMMLKLISRTVGLHQLILLNLYPFLQRYAQPHQKDVTALLAAAVQACHYMVPPDAVEPLFKQIVNQFVHDRSRPEAIAVGLNVVREICLRMPLLMSEELLQDLVLYKKSNEKTVSSAARSLLTLFREICPSLLVKKDRGRPTDTKARPKAYGESNVASNVPGMELLEHDDQLLSSSDDEINSSDSDVVGKASSGSAHCDSDMCLEEKGLKDTFEESLGDDEDADEDDENASDEDCDGKEDDPELCETTSSSDCEDGRNLDGDEESSSDCESDEDPEGSEDVEDFEDADVCSDDIVHDATTKQIVNAGKRKLDDYMEKMKSGDISLRALKKLAMVKSDETPVGVDDGILSNEDFQRIKELKAKKEAKHAMAQHGFKIPSSEQLSVKRVNADTLEANIKRKLTKDERDALHRAAKEERGKYRASAAIKKKKTGGMSNREKERRKGMPIAAKRAKIARSRQEKKKQKMRSGKQFRGKKAWK